MPKDREMGRSYIPTLDGWRAIAILLVVGAHAVPMLLNNDTYLSKKLAAVFIHAGVGVDIFFALSGFLICSLLLDEKRTFGSISLSSFYVRRAFRIVPAILIYLLALLLLESIGWIGSVPPLDIWSVIFFFRNYVPHGTWYTAHFWSLAVEEHFYLLAPMLFAFLSFRASLKGVLALAIICAFVRWAEFTFGFFPGSHLEFRTEDRLDALMYGAVLAHCLHHVEFRLLFKRYITLPVVLGVAIVALVLLAEIPSMPFRRTVVAFVCPLLIGYTVLHSSDWIGRLLESQIMRLIGRMSYSLYIWQMLFLVPSIRDMPVLQSFPWAFASTVACAFVSYRWVEKPMIRIGHRIAASCKSADQQKVAPR